MKTEQEQIKVIKQIIDERVETTLGQVQGRHDNVIKTVDTVIIARDIVNAGYGDVSEYKAEIERLKAENEYRKKQYDNQVAENTLLHIEYGKSFERLKAQQREIDRLKAENCELTKKLEARLTCDFVKTAQKHAKIDVLNKAKERIKTAIDTYFNLDGGGYYLAEDAIDDIDELIKEVQNGEDKS